MELTAKNVEEVFLDCLAGEGNEDTAKIVEGVVMAVGFNIEKLAMHKDDIRSFLDQLDPHFHEGSGDGWTFFNLCADKNGVQWTVEHRVCDCLVTLGLATDQLDYCLPREMWPAFPGGMPYVVVKSAGGGTADTQG